MYFLHLALNSVLDDNRLLTMASGERIKFGADVNFIFETHDLTYASPATISRMGVVYFRYTLERHLIKMNYKPTIFKLYSNI